MGVLIRSFFFVKMQNLEKSREIYRTGLSQSHEKTGKTKKKDKSPEKSGEKGGLKKSHEKSGNLI